MKDKIYAIVQIGNHQHMVWQGDEFEAQIQSAQPGKQVKLNNVLLVSDKKKIATGNPFIKGASVTCDVIKQKRSRKVITVKYKRRKNYKKTIGHRQHLTVLRVKEINEAKT